MIGRRAPYHCPAPDLPDLDRADDARRVLDATEHNAHLARIVDLLAGELDQRVRTDLLDKPDATPEDLVADRYLLLTRMASRYRVAAGDRGQRGSAGASVMLAAVHRLVSSGRLLAV